MKSNKMKSVLQMLLIYIFGVLSLSFACLVATTSVVQAKDDAENSNMVMKSDTVASRLGGYQGIYTFLRDRAVPALLGDAEIASFFGNLTESADDIEQCLAMLLDHDLGGSSPHNGAVLDSGHQCRSSMSNIHRGLKIPDSVVTKFIGIAANEAKNAGISDADIMAIGKVLDRYRGGVRNK